jgi:hypothetical protein
MSNQYEIKSLVDFNKIPQDRLDACLAEFKVWLGIANLATIAGAIASGFTWIDDGETNISINLTAKEDEK